MIARRRQKDEKSYLASYNRYISHLSRVPTGSPCPVRTSGGGSIRTRYGVLRIGPKNPLARAASPLYSFRFSPRPMHACTRERGGGCGSSKTSGNGEVSSITGGDDAAAAFLSRQKLRAVADSLSPCLVAGRCWSCVMPVM